MDASKAQRFLELLPDLERFLAMKAAEDFEAGMGEAEEADDADDMEAAESPVSPPGGGEKPGGMGVVIALKPKGGGDKVPGCPDCEDGTPHQHTGK